MHRVVLDKQEDIYFPAILPEGHARPLLIDIRVDERMSDPASSAVPEQRGAARSNEEQPPPQPAAAPQNIDTQNPPAAPADDATQRPSDVGGGKGGVNRRIGRRSRAVLSVVVTQGVKRAGGGGMTPNESNHAAAQLADAAAKKSQVVKALTTAKLVARLKSMAEHRGIVAADFAASQSPRHSDSANMHPATRDASFASRPAMSPAASFALSLNIPFTKAEAATRLNSVPQLALENPRDAGPLCLPLPGTNTRLEDLHGRYVSDVDDTCGGVSCSTVVSLQADMHVDAMLRRVGLIRQRACTTTVPKWMLAMGFPYTFFRCHTVVYDERSNSWRRVQTDAIKRGDKKLAGSSWHDALFNADDDDWNESDSEEGEEEEEPRGHPPRTTTTTTAASADHAPSQRAPSTGHHDGKSSPASDRPHRLRGGASDDEDDDDDDALRTESSFATDSLDKEAPARDPGGVDAVHASSSGGACSPTAHRGGSQASGASPAFKSGCPPAGDAPQKKIKPKSSNVIVSSSWSRRLRSALAGFISWHASTGVFKAEISRRPSTSNQDAARLYDRHDEVAARGGVLLVLGPTFLDTEIRSSGQQFTDSGTGGGGTLPSSSGRRGNKNPPHSSSGENPAPPQRTPTVIGGMWRSAAHAGAVPLVPRPLSRDANARPSARSTWVASSRPQDRRLTTLRQTAAALIDEDDQQHRHGYPLLPSEEAIVERSRLLRQHDARVTVNGVLETASRQLLATLVDFSQEDRAYFSKAETRQMARQYLSRSLIEASLTAQNAAIVTIGFDDATRYIGAGFAAVHGERGNVSLPTSYEILASASQGGGDMLTGGGSGGGGGDRRSGGGGGGSQALPMLVNLCRPEDAPLVVASGGYTHCAIVSPARYCHQLSSTSSGEKSSTSTRKGRDADGSRNATHNQPRTGASKGDPFYLGVCVHCGCDLTDAQLEETCYLRQRRETNMLHDVAASENRLGGGGRTGPGSGIGSATVTLNTLFDLAIGMVDVLRMGYIRSDKEDPMEPPSRLGTPVAVVLVGGSLNVNDEGVPASADHSASDGIIHNDVHGARQPAVVRAVHRVVMKGWTLVIIEGTGGYADMLCSTIHDVRRRRRRLLQQLEAAEAANAGGGAHAGGGGSKEKARQREKVAKEALTTTSASSPATSDEHYSSRLDPATYDAVFAGQVIVIPSGTRPDQVQLMVANALGGGEILKQGWAMVATWRLNEDRWQFEHESGQLIVICMTLLTTCVTGLVTFLQLLDYYTNSKLTVRWSSSLFQTSELELYLMWRLLQWSVVLSPVVATWLHARWQNSEPLAKWVALKVARETLTREIFMYRTKQGPYSQESIEAQERALLSGKAAPNADASLSAMAATGAAAKEAAATKNEESGTQQQQDKSSGKGTNDSSTSSKRPAPRGRDAKNKAADSDAEDDDDGPSNSLTSRDEVFGKRMVDIQIALAGSAVADTSLKRASATYSLPVPAHVAPFDDGMRNLDAHDYVHTRLLLGLMHLTALADRYQWLYSVCTYGAYFWTACGTICAALATLGLDFLLAALIVVAALTTAYVRFSEQKKLGPMLEVTNQAVIELKQSLTWFSSVGTNVDDPSVLAKLVSRTESSLEGVVLKWARANSVGDEKGRNVDQDEDAAAAGAKSEPPHGDSKDGDDAKRGAGGGVSQEAAADAKMVATENWRSSVVLESQGLSSLADAASLTSVIAWRDSERSKAALLGEGKAAALDGTLDRDVATSVTRRRQDRLAQQYQHSKLLNVVGQMRSLLRQLDPDAPLLKDGAAAGDSAQQQAVRLNEPFVPPLPAPFPKPRSLAEILSTNCATDGAALLRWVRCAYVYGIDAAVHPWHHTHQGESDLTNDVTIPYRDQLAAALRREGGVLPPQVVSWLLHQRHDTGVGGQTRRLRALPHLSATALFGALLIVKAEGVAACRPSMTMSGRRYFTAVENLSVSREVGVAVGHLLDIGAASEMRDAEDWWQSYVCNLVQLATGNSRRGVRSRREGDESEPFARDGVQQAAPFGHMTLGIHALRQEFILFATWSLLRLLAKAVFKRYVSTWVRELRSRERYEQWKARLRQRRLLKKSQLSASSTGLAGGENTDDAPTGDSKADPLIPVVANAAASDEAEVEARDEAEVEALLSRQDYLIAAAADRAVDSNAGSESVGRMTPPVDDTQAGADPKVAADDVMGPAFDGGPLVGRGARRPTQRTDIAAIVAAAHRLHAEMLRTPLDEACRWLATLDAWLDSMGTAASVERRQGTSSSTSSSSPSSSSSSSSSSSASGAGGPASDSSSTSSSSSSDEEDHEVGVPHWAGRGYDSATAAWRLLCPEMPDCLASDPRALHVLTAAARDVLRSELQFQRACHKQVVDTAQAYCAIPRTAECQDAAASWAQHHAVVNEAIAVPSPAHIRISEEAFFLRRWFLDLLAEKGRCSAVSAAPAASITPPSFTNWLSSRPSERSAFVGSLLRNGGGSRPLVTDMADSSLSILQLLRLQHADSVHLDDAQDDDDDDNDDDENDGGDGEDGEDEEDMMKYDARNPALPSLEALSEQHQGTRARNVEQRSTKRGGKSRRHRRAAQRSSSSSIARFGDDDIKRWWVDTVVSRASAELMTRPTQPQSIFRPTEGDLQGAKASPAQRPLRTKVSFASPHVDGGAQSSHEVKFAAMEFTYSVRGALYAALLRPIIFNTNFHSRSIQRFKQHDGDMLPDAGTHRDDDHDDDLDDIQLLRKVAWLRGGDHLRGEVASNRRHHGVDDPSGWVRGSDGARPADVAPHLAAWQHHSVHRDYCQRVLVAGQGRFSMPAVAYPVLAYVVLEAAPAASSLLADGLIGHSGGEGYRSQGVPSSNSGGGAAQPAITAAADSVSSIVGSASNFVASRNDFAWIASFRAVVDCLAPTIFAGGGSVSDLPLALAMALRTHAVWAHSFEAWAIDDHHSFGQLTQAPAGSRLGCSPTLLGCAGVQDCASTVEWMESLPKYVVAARSHDVATFDRMEQAHRGDTTMAPQARATVQARVAAPALLVAQRPSSLLSASASTVFSRDDFSRERGSTQEQDLQRWNETRAAQASAVREHVTRLYKSLTPAFRLAHVGITGSQLWTGWMPPQLLTGAVRQLEPSASTATASETNSAFDMGGALGSDEKTSRPDHAAALTAALERPLLRMYTDRLDPAFAHCVWLRNVVQPFQRSVNNSRCRKAMRRGKRQEASRLVSMAQRQRLLMLAQQHEAGDSKGSPPSAMGSSITSSHGEGEDDPLLLGATARSDNSAEDSHLSDENAVPTAELFDVRASLGLLARQLMLRMSPADILRLLMALERWTDASRGFFSEREDVFSGPLSAGEAHCHDGVRRNNMREFWLNHAPSSAPATARGPFNARRIAEATSCGCWRPVPWGSRLLREATTALQFATSTVRSGDRSAAVSCSLTQVLTLLGDARLASSVLASIVSPGLSLAPSAMVVQLCNRLGLRGAGLPHGIRDDIEEQFGSMVPSTRQAAGILRHIDKVRKLAEHRQAGRGGRVNSRTVSVGPMQAKEAFFQVLGLLVGHQPGDPAEGTATRDDGSQAVPTKPPHVTAGRDRASVSSRASSVAETTTSVPEMPPHDERRLSSATKTGRSDAPSGRSPHDAAVVADILLAHQYDLMRHRTTRSLEWSERCYFRSSCLVHLVSVCGRQRATAASDSADAKGGTHDALPRPNRSDIQKANDPRVIVSLRRPDEHNDTAARHHQKTTSGKKKKDHWKPTAPNIVTVLQIRLLPAWTFHLRALHAATWAANNLLDLRSTVSPTPACPFTTLWQCLEGRSGGSAIAAVAAFVNRCSMVEGEGGHPPRQGTTAALEEDTADPLRALLYHVGTSRGGRAVAAPALRFVAGGPLPFWASGSPERGAADVDAQTEEAAVSGFLDIGLLSWALFEHCSTATQVLLRPAPPVPLLDVQDVADQLWLHGVIESEPRGVPTPPVTAFARSMMASTLHVVRDHSLSTSSLFSPALFPTFGHAVEPIPTQWRFTACIETSRSKVGAPQKGSRTRAVTGTPTRAEDPSATFTGTKQKTLASRPAGAAHPPLLVTVQSVQRLTQSTSLLATLCFAHRWFTLPQTVLRDLDRRCEAFSISTWMPEASHRHVLAMLLAMVHAFTTNPFPALPGPTNSPESILIGQAHDWTVPPSAGPTAAAASSSKLRHMSEALRFRYVRDCLLRGMANGQTTPAKPSAGSRRNAAMTRPIRSQTATTAPELNAALYSLSCRPLQEASGLDLWAKWEDNIVNARRRRSFMASGEGAASGGGSPPRPAASNSSASSSASYDGEHGRDSELLGGETARRKQQPAVTSGAATRRSRQLRIERDLVAVVEALFHEFMPKAMHEDARYVLGALQSLKDWTESQAFVAAGNASVPATAHGTAPTETSPFPAHVFQTELLAAAHAVFTSTEAGWLYVRMWQSEMGLGCLRQSTHESGVVAPTERDRANDSDVTSTTGGDTQPSSDFDASDSDERDAIIQSAKVETQKTAAKIIALAGLVDAVHRGKLTLYNLGVGGGADEPQAPAARDRGATASDVSEATAAALHKFSRRMEFQRRHNEQELRCRELRDIHWHLEAEKAVSKDHPLADHPAPAAGSPPKVEAGPGRPPQLLARTTLYSLTDNEPSGYGVDLASDDWFYRFILPLQVIYGEAPGASSAVAAAAAVSSTGSPSLVNTVGAATRWGAQLLRRASMRRTQALFPSGEPTPAAAEPGSGTSPEDPTQASGFQSLPFGDSTPNADNGETAAQPPHPVVDVETAALLDEPAASPVSQTETATFSRRDTEGASIFELAMAAVARRRKRGGSSTSGIGGGGGLPRLTPLPPVSTGGLIDADDAFRGADLLMHTCVVLGRRLCGALACAVADKADADALLAALKSSLMMATVTMSFDFPSSMMAVTDEHCTAALALAALRGVTSARSAPENRTATAEDMPWMNNIPLPRSRLPPRPRPPAWLQEVSGW